MLAARVGDEVEVRFTGKISSIENTGNLSECFQITSRDSGFTHAIYQGATEDVTVVKAANPENWPVQEDDVWKCGSYVYHVIGGKMVRMRVGSSYTTSRSAEELRVSGVKMELLYRNFK